MLTPRQVGICVIALFALAVPFVGLAFAQEENPCAGRRP